MIPTCGHILNEQSVESNSFYVYSAVPSNVIYLQNLNDSPIWPYDQVFLYHPTEYAPYGTICSEKIYRCSLRGKDLSSWLDIGNILNEDNGFFDSKTMLLLNGFK